MDLTVIFISLIASVILLVSIWFIFKFFKKDNEETNVLEMRKNQTATSFRENALKRKLEAMVEDRAKRSKRVEIEEMCLQAGLPMSYGEYKIAGYFIGIILAIAILMGLNNVFMAIIFVFIGTLIPGQIIHAIRNRRVLKMEEQIGSFMRLVIERYATTKDFAKSIQDTTEDFKGQEPIYSELRHISAELGIGMNTTEALRNLAKRSGSPYLTRMADYYEIASDLGTIESRENLLKQALKQYEENRSMKSRLRTELAAPAREAYMMVAMVPLITIYMASATPSYIEFMTQTTMGQFFVTGIVLVLIGVVWFINKQIGKPLD